ncbi:MAG: hypothetical protein AAF558_00125 [Verrucomicrobiota bacterium]
MKALSSSIDDPRFYLSGSGADSLQSSAKGIVNQCWDGERFDLDRCNQLVGKPEFAVLFAGFTFRKWQSQFWSLVDHSAGSEALVDWFVVGLGRVGWVRDWDALGMPCHDTYRRADALLEAVRFEAGLDAKMASLSQSAELTVNRLRAEGSQIGEQIQRRGEELSEEGERRKERMLAEQAPLLRSLEAQKRLLQAEIESETEKARIALQENQEIEKILEML